MVILMNKKVAFDYKKYIKVSVWKLLAVLILPLLFFFLFNVIFRLHMDSTDWQVILVALAFFLSLYACRLYLNYKYYKQYFVLEYSRNGIKYEIVRFSNLLESVFNIFDSQTEIHLLVDRVERIEKKLGRIYIYGKMTEEKTITKTKIKIVTQYSIPDYCVGEEEMIAFFENK